MIFDVQYSLIRFIEDNVLDLTAVHWIYDGKVIPIDAVQPFATVDFMVDEVSIVSKAPTAQSVIRFQVGVQSEDVRTQYRNVAEIKNILLFGKAIYYHVGDDEVAVGIGTIQFVVNDITNFRAETIEHESLYNRTYLDVKASITYHK